MIQFEQVGKRFGDFVAVDNLSLRLADGEFTVLIGPSGSGKSTTLKMINRLVEHDQGRILFAGQEIRSFREEDLRRRMGYAIQSIGLFPHWTVAQNIATVPALLKWPKARVAARVEELLHLLGLPPAEFSRRYPHQLSGGQQQRVGVARALAADPEVLLMDEPFGALDPVTRSALQTEIARIHQVSGKAIVLVTHDIDEALLLADRIVMLDRGRVVQDGTPRQILLEPASDFVTSFVGRSEVGLKLLALDQVASRMRQDQHIEGPAITGTATLREALSALIANRTEQLPVVDEHGHTIGSIHVADLLDIAA